MNEDRFIEELEEGVYYYPISKLEDFNVDLENTPISYKILGESLLRNLISRRTTKDHILTLFSNNSGGYKRGIPFYVNRIVMHDLALGNMIDLASFREAAAKMGMNPDSINPLLPVDVVIDHSVQVDYFGTRDSYIKNLELEFKRNKERYEFIKWFSGAFRNVRVLPPSIGIIHQINLEYLSTLVAVKEIDGLKVAIPDTVIGLDSHTPMINGLGVLGWGVGGIEGVGLMLGEPISLNPPKVVGVKFKGKLGSGVVATDVALALTEKLREKNVVEKFIEFYGPSIGQLNVFDRATISNMCPEYGATVALFPVDDLTLNFLELTGKDKKLINLVKKYYQKQGIFWDGKNRNEPYNEVIEIDLSEIEPYIAGPNLPTIKIRLGDLPKSFFGYVNGMSNHEQPRVGESTSQVLELESIGEDQEKKEVVDGDIVIASITSCTNTSNPRSMIAAGLLAKNAFLKGLRVNNKIKTSLAPGSRVVEKYLNESGLLEYFEKLGFDITGFGCMTCGGNGGPLVPWVEEQVLQKGLKVVSVTSSNRNFESRIHRNVKVNYITSPHMVVALALLGNVTRNPVSDPLGVDSEGRPIYLKDIWPSDKEIDEVMDKFVSKSTYSEVYSHLDKFNSLWDSLRKYDSVLFPWDPSSTYVQPSPFLGKIVDEMKQSSKGILKARVILVLGDNVTTDHISPEGYISKDSEAGQYLKSLGVSDEELGTYGSRRGNPEVKIRGAFSNNRLKNKLIDIEGGYTRHYPSGDVSSVFNIAMRYRNENVPLLIFAGYNYGMGSSRDWAAKGTAMLGIRAVIARSFERIHKENLICMGVLPLEFINPKDSYESLNVDPSKTIDIILPKTVHPGCNVLMQFTDRNNRIQRVNLRARLDTELEVAYFMSGGLMPFVLQRLSENSKASKK